MSDRSDGLQHTAPKQQPGTYVRGNLSWTPAEDAELARLIQDEDISSWTRLAERLQLAGFPRRDSRRVRERWVQVLCVDRSPFTPAESYQLFAAYRLLGARWADIARVVGGGRTSGQVKGQFNQLAKSNHVLFQALQQNAPLPTPDQFSPNNHGPVHTTNSAEGAMHTQPQSTWTVASSPTGSGQELPRSAHSSEPNRQPPHTQTQQARDLYIASLLAGLSNVTHIPPPPPALMGELLGWLQEVQHALVGLGDVLGKQQEQGGYTHMEGQESRVLDGHRQVPASSLADVDRSGGSNSEQQQQQDAQILQMRFGQQSVLATAAAHAKSPLLPSAVAAADHIHTGVQQAKCVLPNRADRRHAANHEGNGMELHHAGATEGQLGGPCPGGWMSPHSPPHTHTHLPPYLPGGPMDMSLGGPALGGQGGDSDAMCGLGTPVIDCDQRYGLPWGLGVHGAGGMHTPEEGLSPMGGRFGTGTHV